MSTLNERLAIVETRIEQIAEDGERREETQRLMLESLEKLKDSIEQINNTVSKYKGFIGGIAFVLSCIGVFFSKFGLAIWQFLSNKPHG